MSIPNNIINCAECGSMNNPTWTVCCKCKANPLVDIMDAMIGSPSKPHPPVMSRLEERDLALQNPTPPTAVESYKQEHHLLEVYKCCGQPPRLISGPGIGYTLICMECGRGIHQGQSSSTFMSASFMWDQYFEDLPVMQPGVGKVLLDELNAANEVLRKVAFKLGVGGYNSSQVNAKVFEQKILEGIDMLVDPLIKQVEELRATSVHVAEDLATVLHGQTVYTLRKDGSVAVLRIDGSFVRPIQTINQVGLYVQELFERRLAEKKEPWPKIECL